MAQMLCSKESATAILLFERVDLSACRCICFHISLNNLQEILQDSCRSTAAGVTEERTWSDFQEGLQCLKHAALVLSQSPVCLLLVDLEL